MSYLCWKYKEKILDLIKWEKTKENLVNEDLLAKKEKKEEDIKKLIKKNKGKEIFELEKLFKDLLEINENIVNEVKEKEINKILVNEKNKYDGLNEKFLLLNKILKAKKIENVEFEEYKELFETEFMDFANEDSTLENEAEVILKFKELEQEIEKMITFDFLYFKNIISVGGGFSAGKSSFLNGFFDVDKIKLPEGVETVTAIPTYVTQGDEKVLGFSSKGGLINLDSKLYGKLTYTYMKDFQFNIKEIMPYVIIETNVKNGEFENICFIDTPGYDSGTQIQDKNTSWQEIQYSNSVIWVIEATAGTLKKSDLDFLSDNRLSEKKKYIVLNKSDLKPENDIRDIVDEIIDILNENMIEFEGISAYSSRTKKEFFFKRKSLFEFLKNENKKIKAEEKIVKKIQELFNEYRKSIEREKNNLKEKVKYIKSLEREILENNFDNSEKILDNLLQFRKSFSYTYLDENLLKLSEIETKFIKCIGEIFNVNLKVETILQKRLEFDKKLGFLDEDEDDEDYDEDYDEDEDDEDFDEDEEDEDYDEDEDDEDYDEDEEYEDLDEIMLEIMQDYEYDYEEIAKDIFKGKIHFINILFNISDSDSDSFRYYETFALIIGDNIRNDNIDEDSFLQGITKVEKDADGKELIKFEKIKYEKGILKFGVFEINDKDIISEAFNILVKCLTEHGEYLKTYLQKE